MPSYTKHLERLKAQLSTNPENVSFLLDLGFFFFEDAHIPEKALEYFEKALSLQPKNAHIMHWIARVHYFERADFDAARQTLEKALKIDPHNPECLNLYACLIREYPEGTVEAYLLYVKKAIEIAPEWPSSHCQLAIGLGRMGRWEEAESEIAITHKLLRSPPHPKKNDREDYFQRAVMGFSPLSDEHTALITHLIQERRSDLLG